jgi:hypothetical protein
MKDLIIALSDVLASNSKLIFAFLVGFLGSAAYITALYFKFVGDSDQNRSIILKPFCKSTVSAISYVKCFWYCIIGGFIAVVFQFDVPNFVAVQSLILGATWPAIVSQFLSGRMSEPSPKEKAAAEFLSSPTADRGEYQSTMEKLKKELETIIGK